MANNILEQIKKNLTKYRKHKRWNKIVSVMMALVVFVTTYALILPAITMEIETNCGLQEHIHTEECYEATFETKTELVCTLPEIEGHNHDGDCYYTDRILVCDYTEEYTDQEDTEGDTEEIDQEDTEEYIDQETTEEFTDVYVEEDTGHDHTEDCYEEKEVLECDQEEVEAHIHTEECYTNTEIEVEENLELVCEEIEHTHTEECYPEENPDEYILTATTSEGIIVVLEGPSSSFDQNLEELSLTVEELDIGEESLATMDLNLERDGLVAENVRSFDIRLWHEEEEVEPIGPVSVTFSSVENPGKSDAKVYHIDEEEDIVTDMEAILDRYGNIILDTNHFSIYAIALVEPLAANTMTLDDIVDGLGITNQFAVFARRMGARGHMEGSIAVQEMELLYGPTFDFGNTGSVGSNAGSSNNVNLKITKITEGDAPAGQEYKFGIYDSSNENNKLHEVIISGSGSTTITLSPGNYRVYELDSSGNKIEHASNSAGFTVTYDAINLSGYLGGGHGNYVNNASYIESFLPTNVSKMHVQNVGFLYVGEGNTIDTSNENSPIIKSGNYSVEVESIRNRIDKPTNINWEDEFNRIEELSRDLAAQTTTDYNKDDLTTPGVKFVNIVVPSSGDVTKEIIANAIDEDDLWLNNGIPLGPTQYLVINLDTSQVTGNSVSIPSVAPNKTNAGGWHPDYGRFMWNLHSGSSDYTGEIEVGESAGTILAPKATLKINGILNGAALVDHVIKDEDPGHEIHQISFRPPWMAQTTVTNTYDGISQPKPDLIINKKGFEGVKLDGVVFKLYKSDNSWSKGELVANQTTNDGQVKFEGLTPGEYLLYETEAPSGYIKPSAPWKITVDEEGQVTIEGMDPGNDGSFTIKNTKQGEELIVEKKWVDAEGNDLENISQEVQVQLWRKWDNTVSSSGSHTVTFNVKAMGKWDPGLGINVQDIFPLHTLKVANGGSINFYSYVEWADTKPHAIELTSNTVEPSTSIEVDDNNSMIPTYIVDDIRGDLTITLDWGDNWWNDGFIPRHKFKVEDTSPPTQPPNPDPGEEESQLVDTITLNQANDWKYQWDKLPSKAPNGNPYYYYVEEIDPPPGFKVSYSDNNTNGVPPGNTITITNTSEYRLPETGGPGTKPYILAGSLLMATSLIYILNRFRKGGHRTANSETKNI